MINFLKRMIAIAALLLLPTAAFAQLDGIDTGLGATAKEGYGLASEEINISLPIFIGAYIVKPILGLTGTLLFALMTYAGFLWVTAQGDTKKVQKAKDILSECIVGTVILVGAYALSNFVVGQLGA